MKNIVPSSDNFFLTRWLLIPYIKQLFRLSRTSEVQNPQFTRPRFEIFRKIDQTQSSIIKKFASKTQKQTYQLLYSLIKAHRSEILLGFLVCLLWTLLNTLTPKIVKDFFRLMKDTAIEGPERLQANYLTQKFIILQVLRLLASANTKRLFGQLAFKVTGALSIKLVQKSLKLSNDCRQLLPESQIYQIQNTDMKAVANFFKQLWVVTQIPFTIISSIFLLFSERLSFGIVGVYWIILIFFLQAWLTDLMMESTNRKLRLTQQRCITNYELMEKMPQARLDLSEQYFLQKNNDFFLKEVKQYHRFHRFMTYFDISLIIMPLVFVISLSFYDYNETVSFTIEEVYILITLIGLCYRPFKNLKKFNLIMSEALYSLRRFSIYFSLPEKRPSLMIKNDELLIPRLQIKSHTITYSLLNSEKSTGFYVDKPISVQSGERLYVLGKRGQGISQFLKSILADFETLKGQICLQGGFAYLPRQNFFLAGTLSQNITFYGSKPQQQLRQVYYQLALDQDFQIRGGLQAKLDTNTLTQRELKKIGLARVIIANRNVIVLDCPFLGLQYSSAQALDQLLRQKQANGAMIIIAERYLKFQQPHDQILIVSKGQIQQYGRLGQIQQTNLGLISEFKQVETMSLSDRISCLNIVRQFQAKIKKIVFLSHIMQGRSKADRQARQKKMAQLCKVVGKYSLKLKEKSQRKSKLQKKQLKNPITMYVMKLFKYVCLIDWLWGGLALLSTEILYVFIQYKFGQQYKQGGKAKFSQIRQLMKYELALAIGLAGLIYIFREIEFSISSIIANHVYKDSINSTLKKKISWYTRSHPSLIAHKYNHDYDEIYSLVHCFFNFVKLILVFLYTVISIDTSGRTAATLTIITTLVYFGLLHIYRKAQDNLIRSYPNYKYEFVKVFDQIIEGAFTINIFGKDQQAIEKAKIGLINVTAFRLSSNNVQIAQEAILELTGSIIVAFGLEYGTKVKLIEGDHNEALVAVSVMLLLNLSDVLKNIYKALVKMESLFRLKLYSYVEVIDLNPVNLISVPMPRDYAIQFKEKLLQTPEDNLFQVYPLSLKIQTNQKILILQKDSVIRKNLVLGLTNNLVDPLDSNRYMFIDIIRMGGQPIKQLSRNDLKPFIATLLPDNFYFSGSLADNLKWKMNHFNNARANRLAEQIKINEELPEFETLGLDTLINGQTQNKELGRKIALLKILLKRPKIVVIKDTPWFVAGKYIVEWLQQEDLDCTIIGVSETPMGVEGVQRVIMMQKGKVLESGSLQDLKKDPLSQSGQLLRSAERETIQMWRAQREEDPLIIKKQRRQLLRAIVQYSLERKR